jgi:hypothetical protein
MTKRYFVWKPGEPKIEHYLTPIDVEFFRYLGFEVALAEDGEHHDLPEFIDNALGHLQNARSGNTKVWPGAGPLLSAFSSFCPEGQPLPGQGEATKGENMKPFLGIHIVRNAFSWPPHFDPNIGFMSFYWGHLGIHFWNWRTNSNPDRKHIKPNRKEITTENTILLITFVAICAAVAIFHL